MIIRTSKGHEASFRLTQDSMIERNYSPWFLYRAKLMAALKTDADFVYVGVGYEGKVQGRDDNPFEITQGKTQRGKKFIQIGCKRFVGVNRTRLIRWAMSAK